MSNMCSFKLDFELTNNKIEEFVSFLNSVYAMQYTYDKSLQLTYGIVCDASQSMFYMICENDFKEILQNKLLLIDPLMQFDDIDDPLITYKNLDFKVDAFSMKMVYSDSNKKIKNQGAEKNFMSNLFSSMITKNNDKCIMEITFIPSEAKYINKNNGVIKKYTKTAVNSIFKGMAIILDETINTDLYKMFSNEDIKEKDSNKKENNKNLDEWAVNSKFYVNIKLISISESVNENKRILTNMASVFADLSSTNRLIPKKLCYMDIFKRKCNDESSFSSNEMAQFMHFPNKDIIMCNLSTGGLRKIYDKDIPRDGIVFGELNGTKIAFPGEVIDINSYKQNYKEYHSIVDNMCKPRLILGQQGTGKSEFLIRYILAQIKLGIGVIVVDPKNDTQQRLIESLPEEYMSKLIYINLGDTVYPPSFNIFKKRHNNDPTENSLIVSSFMSLMKKESRQWGYKMERMCKMTADAILLLEKATLNEFLLMLTEKEYRTHLIEVMRYKLDDPEVKGKSHIKKILSFWETQNEFDEKTFYREVEPVLNIIGPFVGDRLVSAIVSQYDSFDFRKAADQGKIVIINIPEGTLRDNTKLLSSMINKAIWLDIQSRNDVDISERYPVSLLIDEAHEIVDDEFVSILTKARAYRLGLTLVTQGLSNFRIRGMDDIKELINTNCKNKIVFRVGLSDARELQEEFFPLSSYDLNNCPDYKFYGKILLMGKVSSTFAGESLGLAIKIREYDNFIKEHRSGKFTIDEIEDQIDKRMTSIKTYFALKNA